MKRKPLGQIKTIAIVAGCVILAPVIVPYFLIENALADRRRKRDADNFKCDQCGNVLGRAAITKADEYWREHVNELHQRFPDSKFRLVRDVWAICTSCAAKYNYHDKDKRYFRTQDAETATVGPDD